MFGRRSAGASIERIPAAIPASVRAAVLPVHDDSALRPTVEAPRRPEPVAPPVAVKSEDYFRTKSMIFGALIEAIDLSQLSGSMPNRRARRSATSSPRSSA